MKKNEYIMPEIELIKLETALNNSTESTEPTEYGDVNTPIKN